MFGLAHEVLNRSQNYLPIFKKPREISYFKDSRKNEKSGHPKPIFPPCHTWLELPLLEVACYPQFTTIPTIPCSLSSIQPEGLFSLSLRLYCIVSLSWKKISLLLSKCMCMYLCVRGREKRGGSGRNSHGGVL